MVAPPTNAGAQVVLSVESGIARIQVRGGSVSSARVQPRLINLIPSRTKQLGRRLSARLQVFLFIVQFVYYVSGSSDNTVQFLGHYRQCIRETTINGKTVTIEQAKKAIKDEQEALPEDQAFR